MRQIAQNYKSGKVKLEAVDPPALKRGTLLVRTVCSVISPGTEGTKIKEAKMSYLEKAKARPDHVKKVLQSVQQQGLTSTYRKVMNKLDSLTPLGYSASGIVEQIGEGVEGFTLGQRVAIGGAGYANHAEFNVIPASLVVPVPDDVALDEAAFATLGAVSMHGLRQGEMQLGEVALVVGLGLVGQLLVQMLQAAGITVVGVDLDATRCQQAVEDSGALIASLPDDAALKEALSRLSSSAGADCVFLTAGGTSNAPLELALELVRDRGRIVCVGKNKMDLPYDQAFKKEVEFRYSRSYGPGRYDPAYEEKNQDYPIGYVRWTQGRNLGAFITLLRQKRLNIPALITHRYPFAEAAEVYEAMHRGELQGMGVLFDYAEDATLQRSTPTLTTAASAKDHVKMGCIGAGAYASSMLLPHLKEHKRVTLQAVANATPLSAKNAQDKFGFAHSGTDYTLWLGDDAVDAVVIATHHATHPKFTAETLKAGKAVFVEKPLAIDESGLQQVLQAVEETGNNRVLVGFNRRYAPIMQEMKKSLNKGVPLAMDYRVHAGQLDASHWSHDGDEGGRFIGEAGHFLDVFAYLTASHPVSVSAIGLRSPESANGYAADADNLAVNIAYADGSIATLHYLTHGGSRTPKERLEVMGGKRTWVMDNFETLTLYDDDKKPTKKSGYGNQKGQKQQMEAWVEALLKGEAMPIALESIIETTRLTYLAVEAAKRGETVRLV
jgi:predicted dehydrogenase/threonine dehydrogenase-like Zn-dependent dehydrogenase